MSFETLHDNLAAGSFPEHSMNIASSVLLLAQEALGDPRIHFQYVVHDKHVYWVAFPSMSLGAEGGYDSPFVAVLPTHAMDNGDGAYLLANLTSAAAVVRQGTSMYRLVNTVDAVRDAIIDLGLPTYDLSGATPEPLYSEFHWHKAGLDVVSAKTIKYGALAAGLCTFVYLGAQLAGGIVEGATGQRETSIAMELAKRMAEVSLNSPLSKEIASFHALSSTIIRAGGWINGYQYAQGEACFSATMPEWVTGDYIQSLGPGVVAERNTEQPGTINVTRKAKECTSATKQI